MEYFDVESTLYNVHFFFFLCLHYFVFEFGEDLKTLWEYDTENHTEKSNHTEKPLKSHWKALEKIITLKRSLLSHWYLFAIVIQEC